MHSKSSTESEVDDMSDMPTILINGAGTVGNRGADVLLSLGFDVLFGKYGARQDDIKTQELQRLQQLHGKKFTVYAAQGERIEDRLSNIVVAGFKAANIAEMPWEDVALVVDCTDTPKEAKKDPTKDMTRSNVENLYRPNKRPFALNGGAVAELVNHQFFASIPGTTPYRDQSAYRDNNALIVSCNSHTATTLLTLLTETFSSPAEWCANMRDIMVSFHRRYDDPHKGIKPGLFTSVEKVGAYHQDELIALVPRIKGYLTQNVVAKWPVEHFHYVEFVFDFNEKGQAAEVAERLRQSIRMYPRALLVEGKMSQKALAEAAQSKLGIPDGDLPFPAYFVHPLSDYKFGVVAFTPQRGIVAPSTADYALFRTGVVLTLEDAFAHTNQYARWKGVPFAAIKGLEQHLK